METLASIDAWPIEVNAVEVYIVGVTIPSILVNSGPAYDVANVR